MISLYTRTRCERHGEKIRIRDHGVNLAMLNRDTLRTSTRLAISALHMMTSISLLDFQWVCRAHIPYLEFVDSRCSILAE